MSDRRLYNDLDIIIFKCKKEMDEFRREVLENIETTCLLCAHLSELGTYCKLRKIPRRPFYKKCNDKIRR
ncbi:MAG: hypothetical protein ACTSQ8_17525 [Candidatus Helarchaeota archaeon]